MGCSSEINMFFSKEKHARWAMHVAEEMIKLFYAPDELPWIREAAGCPSLSRRYLACREELASYRIDPHNTSLEWLKRNRTNIIVERCQDISRWTGIEDPEDLFPQLCFAYALRFPQVPFTACYRHEMTVSGAIQLIRMQYDGAVMHVQEMTGERPMDEDDWSRELIHNYVAADGVFTKRETIDPMREVKEARTGNHKNNR